MSEREVKKAQLEVQLSTARLENALDHLIDKFEEGNQKFESIQSQVLEVRDQAMKMKSQVEDAARDPQATLAHILGPSVREAEKYIDQRRIHAENYLSDKAQVICTEAKSTLNQAFQDTQILVDNFVAHLRGHTEDLIEKMESNRMASWVSVFFIGCAAGALYAQRIERARRETVKSPVRKPVAVPAAIDVEKPVRRAA